MSEDEKKALGNVNTSPGARLQMPDLKTEAASYLRGVARSYRWAARCLRWRHGPDHWRVQEAMACAEAAEKLAAERKEG